MIHVNGVIEIEKLIFKYNYRHAVSDQQESSWNVAGNPSFEMLIYFLIIV